jgi:hypothetical protein
MTEQRWGLPTEYGGVTFRSRLEARWALFFDALGVIWQYEPEGFDLPSGLYVPDFWVSGAGWFEVKPRSGDSRAVALVNELAVVTGEQVSIAWGTAFALHQGMTLREAGIATNAPGEKADQPEDLGRLWWFSAWQGCRNGHAHLRYEPWVYPPVVCPDCSELAGWTAPVIRDAGERALRATFNRERISPVRLRA